jgi:hypothetical protein
MKVFFGTSPRIIESYSELVHQVYKKIKNLGYSHTSNWVDSVDPKSFYEMTSEELEKHNVRILKELKNADICVFETSLPSLSVGYLINMSIDLGKQVIVLTQKNTPSFVLGWVKSDALSILKYTSENLDKLLEDALTRAESNSDVRFNFFVSPKILNYLDFVAKKRMIPRSVFLRDLIEKEMKKDTGFKKD